MRHIRRHLRLWRDDAGAAMLEFALILPILMLMFLALVEFTDAFSVRRRVEATAASVADLVAQSASVTDADLDGILTFGAAIMRPYSATPLGIRVSSVVQNDEGQPVVAWSYGNGKLTARADGSAFAVPAGLINETTGVVVAETSYVFTPVVGTYLLSGRTFTSTAYFRPRILGTVDKAD